LFLPLLFIQAYIADFRRGLINKKDNPVKQMSKTILRHTLIKKYFWHFYWLPYIFINKPPITTHISIYRNANSLMITERLEFCVIKSSWTSVLCVEYHIYILLEKHFQCNLTIVIVNLIFFLPTKRCTLLTFHHETYSMYTKE
jgi:hypothetical protein